jgi:hypothetical protein
MAFDVQLCDKNGEISRKHRNTLIGLFVRLTV